MESNGIVVRWAEPHDKPAIARLLHLLMVYTAGLYGEHESAVKNPEQVRADLEESFSRPDRFRFIVAVDGDDVAGVCGAEFSYSTWHAKPYIILNDVYVDDRFRRRGVGTKLLDFLCGHAHSIGCCRIDLWVEDNNWCARKLYERYGFSQMKRATYSIDIQPSPGVP
jgi:ribosomal protein S18 acetylase RimI-like enzyme